MANNFYITTTLPYVNATPHIGFALEIVAADVLARYHRLLKQKVVFNTGTDEHGQKIYQKALESNEKPQAYVDRLSQEFTQLKKQLNLEYTHFIRTTDPHHVAAAQTFWQFCAKNGDIYKSQYQTKYCVGCELEKQESELENNRCPLHPDQELELRNEENYFFRFSRYQEKLLALYQENPQFVQPASKMAEIKAFVAGGLQDFSISRLKTKMPWGITVPGDEKHVMYVWFDALTNYITTLGWPENQQNFNQFWPGLQIAGKDNLRQQAAMWQAMLLSAGLPTSSKILINGFISVSGQKMSKSLGNVISPDEMITRFGLDGTRWLLMSLGPVGSDIDVSWEQFDQLYQATLANGLGNLCSRLAKLAEKINLSGTSFQTKLEPELAKDLMAYLDQFAILEAVNWLNQQISEVDKFLSTTKPWLLAGDKQKQLVTQAIASLLAIATNSQIFMPTVSQKILAHFTQEKITSLPPLFPRIEN